jgi:hypothetical protein
MTDPRSRPPPEVVTYFAISILSSRTFWWNLANGVVALLSLAEVVAVIPPRFLSLQLAVVAMVNLYLRTVTVRPVALIAPGTTAPVRVPKIGPPDPPTVTD